MNLTTFATDAPRKGDLTRPLMIDGEIVSYVLPQFLAAAADRDGYLRQMRNPRRSLLKGFICRHA